MSNTVTLPNGSVWDNDLSFSNQEQTAQAWYFDALKSVMNGIVTQVLPEDVLMLNIRKKGIKPDRLNDVFSALEKENLILSCDGFYRHADWGRVLFEGYVIPDEDFYNINNWQLSVDVWFYVSEK